MANPSQGLDLTDDMVDRIGAMYEAVYEMLLVLLEKDSAQFEYDHIVGPLTDTIIDELKDHFGIAVRYPGVVTLADGRQYYSEYDDDEETDYKAR